MLNDATLRNFEDRFQLVQSKAKDTVQSAHCAMKVSLYRRYELLSNSKSIGGDGPSMLQLIHFLHKNQDTDSHTRIRTRIPTQEMANLLFHLLFCRRCRFLGGVGNVVSL